MRLPPSSRRRASGAAALLALLTCLGPGLEPAGAAPPSVGAGAPTEVTYTTARAHGTIDGGGLESFYRFEYIADVAFDRNLKEGKPSFAGAIADGLGRLEAGAAQTPVSPLLGQFGGIEAGVEYHLRLIGENSDGQAIAGAPSFITPKPLEPIPCFGDDCQILPSAPRDPTLTTTVAGLGNPKVHYERYGAKAGHHKPRGKKHHRRHGKSASGKGRG